MNKNDYPYLYETHLHTCQASACGHNTGAEMAKAAKDYGYSGIVVTDHNWGGNTCISSSLGWSDWVDQFSLGFLDAYEYGQKNGLGSDVHSTNIFGGGMAFRKRLESYKELCEMILHGGDYILTNGDEFFLPAG